MSVNASNHPSRALSQAPCVIFDFDGVIADSEEFQLLVWADVFKACGKTPAAFSVQSIAGLLDAQAVQNLWPDGSEQEHAELTELKRKTCQERAREVACVPGIRELLQSLDSRKQLFVCSSSAPDHIHGFLSRELSRIDFAGVVGAGDYRHFKPHPDPYLTVLEKAGVTAEQAIAVEDSPTGVRSARAANIDVIHFDRYRLGSEAALVVHALEELQG